MAWRDRSRNDGGSGQAESGAKARVIPGMLIALAVVVIVALALALWLSSKSGDDGAPVPAPSPAPTSAASPGPEGVRALPESEQMQKAAIAALGAADGKVGEQDGQRTMTEPAGLFWDGDRAILISETGMEDGCHGCSGSLGVHYLKPDGEDGLTVTGSWPDAIDGSSWGRPPAQWRVSRKFADVPVVYATGGGTFQGYTCSVATLTRLGPDGPRAMVSIPLGYDDSGAVISDTRTKLDGKIVNIVPGKRFDVHYTGTETFTDHYVRQGDRYVAQGKLRMQSC
ncbi:hypothetical protein [Stakelama saccharophila]|uniref:Lipoprotein n=1 Tax=Stakelama saccharophila TaxID=3075605 RepID=A0ABZ0B878_9SPHN|nr:hypothetical protein [Stakelama sp. W311]WNO53063.1 hypothetical protein RPR59_11435 [Stakelama sp. W311]